MLTHGSLFAGIGGFDLGFERAGIKTVWQVEIDPFCRKVLESHWPNVRRERDVRDVRGGYFADVITGGFPCQDISQAGTRAGISGARSGLWREMVRSICLVRPKCAVVENVAALLIRGMGTVLGDLAQIGYDAEWDCIRTGLHRGHERSRVFIIANPVQQGLSGTGEYREAENAPEAFYVDAAASSLPRPQPPPEVVRNVHGIPRRMDRIKSLGNAVAPQIAEWIGRRIVACAKYEAVGSE